MKVSTLTAHTPASFEYTYTDAEGEKKETINLQLRRISFGLAYERLDALGDKPPTTEFTAILAELIADWNLYEDDEETKKFPITAEWLASKHCPAGFFAQLMDCVFDALRGKAPASDSPNGSEPEAQSSQVSAATSASSIS